MTSITVQDGQIVLRDGAIGTEQACCCKKCSGPCEENEDCAPGCRCVDGECVEECSGPCEENEDCAPGCRCVDGECVEAECCTCENEFFVYANGALLNGNSRFQEFNTPRVEWIPGLYPFFFQGGVFTDESYGATGVDALLINSDSAAVGECDENGDLIIRVNIYNLLSIEPDGPFNTEVVESRFYKFSMANGGCGPITGTTIDPPADAEQDVFLNQVGIIEGQTIVYIGGTDDPAFRMDWSSINIQATCETGCIGGLFEDDDTCDGQCADGCVCDEVQFFGVAGFTALNVYACRLNPLP